MLENGENEKIEVRDSLKNSWFVHRREVEEQINKVKASMKGLFRVLGEEHSWWALSDYDHHRELTQEEGAIYKAHEDWLKEIRDNVAEAGEIWYGRDTRWGYRDGGLKEKLWHISRGACPQCGGFTESDGERDSDGCSADWATTEHSWSWCVGFGYDTELTGDCCSLKRRQEEKASDNERKRNIENYCEWLYLGGMSTITKRLYSGDFGFMSHNIDSLYRENAVRMVNEMCGIYSDRWSEWVIPEQYRPREGLFTRWLPYRSDVHDEDCEHRSGCGWSTSSSRIVASGGY